MTGDIEPGTSEFERRTRALLRDSADHLPGAVRSRLTRARYAALASRSSRRIGWAGRWIPAGAVAAALLALMIVFAPREPVPPANAMSNAALEDMELLADSDAVQLTGQLAGDQEVDYDFYEWAVGEADGPAAPSVGT